MQIVRPPISPICTLDEARTILADLVKIDPASVTIDELKSRMFPLFRGFACTAWHCDAGLRLFRARKGKYDTVAEVSYPPASECKEPGRANAEGRPKFYCANHRHAVFYEIHAEPGEIITIAHWETKGRLIASQLGYLRQVFDKLQSTRQFPPLGDPGLLFDEHSRLVGEFLHREFMREVRNGEEDLYKFTAAVAEKHLNQTYVAADSIPLRYDDPPPPSHPDAVMYPSIALWANADNFAIEPAYVDRHMDLLFVEAVRIDRQNGREYELTEVDFARPDVDGVLKWTGRPRKWVMREKGGTGILMQENGVVTLRDGRGIEILPE